jgi:hypothetical protein
MHFFTDLKIIDKAGTQTPWYLWWSPPLHDFKDFFFSWLLLQKSTVQVYISSSLFITLKAKTKQIYELSYKNRNSHYVSCVQWQLYKINNNTETAQ